MLISTITSNIPFIQLSLMHRITEKICKERWQHWCTKISGVKVLPTLLISTITSNMSLMLSGYPASSFFKCYLLKSRSSIHSYVEIHGSKVEVFKVGIAKWRHCMTWLPLLLRWFLLLNKKREKWPGHVLQSRHPTFLELDPSFGASTWTQW